MTQALTLDGLSQRLRASFGLAVSPERPAGATVPDASAFGAAMKAAKGGDTLYLAPGAYPLLTLTNFVRDQPVTLLALDPANPPVVAGFKFSACRNIVVRGLDIMIGTSGTGVEVLGGSDIHVEGNEIHGPVTDTRQRYGKGARFRGVIRWSFVCNDVHDVIKGVDHFLGAADSSFGRIDGNSFRDLCGDAITGCTDNLTIVGNVGTDLYRIDANHPDFIQLGTPGAWRKGQPVNIRIEGNVYYLGKGTPNQGIFVKSEQAATLQYSGLEIRRNAIVGAMYHGIGVGQAVDPVIEGNFVQGMAGVVDSAGKAMHCWLRLANSQGGTIARNILSRAVGQDANSPAPILTDNATTQRLAPAGDYSDLLAFVDKMFPAAVPADPRDAVIDSLTAQVETLTANLAAADAKAAEVAEQLQEAQARAGVAAERIELLEGERDAARAKAADLRVSLANLGATAAALATSAADAAQA